MKLIILPGWQHGSDHWSEVANQLRDKQLDVTVIDLPGFGKEPYQSNMKSITEVANWLKTKIDSISKGEKYVLIGHSYGGRVAVSVAAMKPVHLSGLVLCSSPNLYHPSLTLRVKKIISQVLQPIKQYVPESLRSRLRSEDYQAVKGKGLETLFRNIIGDQQIYELKSLNVPTLLIWGDKDEAVPLTVAKSINRLITNSSIDIFKGVGHNIHLEKPQLLAGKIYNYVQSI